MRSFAEYIFYFKGNSAFKLLVSVAENDQTLPIGEKDVDKALNYFITNSDYNAVFPQIEKLHERYLANLNPHKRILW